MRIINLSEFIKMPKGTVYSKYAPCHFDGLMIKDDNCTNQRDFYYQNLIGNVENCSTGDFIQKCEFALLHGLSISLDFDVVERDAMYFEDQLFAVYEKKDIEGLIKCLTA